MAARQFNTFIALLSRPNPEQLKICLAAPSACPLDLLGKLCNWPTLQTWFARRHTSIG